MAVIGYEAMLALLKGKVSLDPNLDPNPNPNPNPDPDH